MLHVRLHSILSPMSNYCQIYHTKYQSNKMWTLTVKYTYVIVIARLYQITKVTPQKKIVGQHETPFKTTSGH